MVQTKGLEPPPHRFKMNNSKSRFSSIVTKGPGHKLSTSAAEPGQEMKLLRSEVVLLRWGLFSSLKRESQDPKNHWDIPESRREIFTYIHTFCISH